MSRINNCVKTTNKKPNVGGRKIKEIKEIILHCSATQDGQNYDIETIRQWHTTPNRNWSDVGYHWVIDTNGKIMKGRDESVCGAHCSGRNSFSIGVCYIGGLDKDNISNAKDTRTDAQKQSLIKLLTELHERYPMATLHGHNEFANKACPSFTVAEQEDLTNIFK